MGSVTGIKAIVMTRKSLTEPAQIDSTLETARQLWESKRDQADFPPRSAFSLRDLRSVIHNLAFIGIEGEAESLHRYRIKFMGDELVRVLGNHTGEFVMDAFRPPRAKKLCDHFAEAERTRVPMTLFGAMSEGGDDHLEHHTLIAPLAEDGASLDGFMVVILFHPAK